MRNERCETCRFGVPEQKVTYLHPAFATVPVIGCYRFPAKVDKGPADWCGEWKPDADYLADKVLNP